MPIIILEGPDGGGKTTLARQLCERYGAAYHHEGPPPLNVPPLLWYGRVLESVRGQNVVLDRLALGERVYGPVARNSDRLGEDGWRVFNRLIMAVGAWQVLCLPPYQAAFMAWSSGRDEFLKTREKFDKTYDAYIQFRGTQDVEYDYTQRGAFERLVSHIDKHSSRGELAPRMVGSPVARVMLVGDRTPKTTLDLPFFDTRGPSRYLLRGLDAANIRENDICFVNACAPGSMTPLELPRLPALGSRYVALGNQALTFCRRQRIDALLVPHPQYWQRFYNRDIEGYAYLLRDACR